MPQSECWKILDREVDFNNESPLLLEKQLGDMEGEMKIMQEELAAIKQKRDVLNRNIPAKHYGVEGDVTKEINSFPPRMHEEKYQKLNEISKLREDLIRAKNAADDERFQREKYEEKLRDLEKKLNVICYTNDTTAKDLRNNNSEDVEELKNQIRDLKEEIEEMKISVGEKTEQLQDYRAKYLQAQQQVEEYRRQLDIIEYDNKQVSDQIQIEIQRMKMQFQDKLQELAPLPDLLKGAQIQLQEAKQLQKLAEDSSQQLSNELNRVKEKLVIAVNNLNQEKADRITLSEDNKHLKSTLDAKEKELLSLNSAIENYTLKLSRMEEKFVQQEARLKEKCQECSQILKDLEGLRNESERSLARSKERSDSMRRYLQTQISELERQLVQSRAQSRACQKERDDIRQRMQLQINNLQENFEMADIRLRTLQNQVTSLKSSYTVILADEDSTELNKISIS